MTKPVDPAVLSVIENYDAEQRLKYLLQEVKENQQIWILTDEHGSVMMTMEDEDGLPVWPHKECAQAWATDEWQHCQPLSIDLATWFKRWTPGLESDEINVVAFPNQSEDGIILFPDEFERDIKHLK